MSITQLLQVIEILAPLVDDLSKYLREGGEKPQWFSVLPSVSRSRIEIERRKVRAG